MIKQHELLFLRFLELRIAWFHFSLTGSNGKVRGTLSAPTHRRFLLLTLRPEHLPNTCHCINCSSTQHAVHDDLGMQCSCFCVFYLQLGCLVQVCFVRIGI